MMILHLKNLTKNIKTKIRYIDFHLRKYNIGIYKINDIIRRFYRCSTRYINI